MKTASLLIAIIAMSVVTPLRAQIYQWNTNGHFYQPIAVAEDISWTAASNAAVVAGGYLVSITSAEENAFVYSLIETNGAVWNLVGSGHGPWIGALRHA